MPLSLVAPPEVEPIDADDIRAQLRLTSRAEDAFLAGMVAPSVRMRMERATRRQANTATWDLVLDAFPVTREGLELIELPLPPLQSVTWIKYVDISGVLQTWSSSEYQVQAPVGPNARRGRIMPAFNYSWPATREQMGAVTVRFVCGYGDDPEDVPTILRQAMLLDAGALYEFRENLQVSGNVPVEIPHGASSIYVAHRSLPRYPLPGGID